MRVYLSSDFILNKAAIKVTPKYSVNLSFATDSLAFFYDGTFRWLKLDMIMESYSFLE